MLEFYPLTAEQIPLVRADLTRPVPQTCDYSLGGVLLWRDYFQVQFARVGGSMIYRLRLPDGTEAFQPPADPDERLLSAVYEHCRGLGEPCRFAFVPSERKPLFYSLFGGNVVCTPQREWYDYLYEKNALITYAGKKLRGQRNHVNKFLAAFPHWKFRRGTTDDLPRLREFYALFRQENQKDAPTWLEEEKKIEEVFDRFDEYSFLCGILTVDGEIVGFSLGEIVGDTLVVHTEKAHRNFPGAYPMLASRFVSEFAGNNPAVRYVNREDDSGDPGLRTAKLSYHPCALLEKFLVEIP